MRSLKFSLLFLFVISCKDIGEGYFWEGETTPGFSRNFGTVGYDYGWNAAYSPFDNGTILVGKTTPEINGQSDLWAIKVNDRGLVIWEKKFGGLKNEEGYDVISTSDGGYLFVGFSWSYGNEQQIYAVKTDFYGNIEWEKNYGGQMWEVGQSVIQLSTGEYMIAGNSNSPGISSGNTDIYLLKLDIQGNKIWEKAYGNQAFPNHEWAYDIVQTIDDGFMIAGARDRYSKGSVNGLVIRVDKLGNIIWEKELVDEEQVSETIYSISKSTNGNYYLCASINSSAAPEVYQPKIIKIDAYGNIDWERIFNSNSRKYHQFRATVTQNKDIILVGTSFHQLNIGFKEDAFMIKINSKGSIVWSNSYGTYDGDDWGWSVFETPQKNIVFVGSTESFNASLFDIYLVSTNAEGISQ